jgi:NAD(P)-dependent dehydrogenase (short-subunit alcohol dehydrogenase family)
LRRKRHHGLRRAPAQNQTLDHEGTEGWADASTTDGVNALITLARNEFGPVDVDVANTGIVGPPGLGDDEADWDRVMDVNVRAYVKAAKALCARLARPRPWIFRRCRLGRRTAHQIDAADYSVTKHAAVDFAEWLSITYDGAFLVLPHPIVGDMYRQKRADYER